MAFGQSRAAFRVTQQPRVAPEKRKKNDAPKGEKANEADAEDAGPNEERVYVFRDSDSPENHGEFTNVMPAEGAQMLDLALADKTDPKFGEDSISLTVNFKPPLWCGVVAASQADYWGKEPSDSAFDLSRARKLVFYARGDRGGETIQVKVAIAGDQKFGDSAPIPAATPWLKLGKQWKRYELSVEKLDLSRVITPFAVVTSKAQNDRNSDSTEVKFYLDHIYFVMGRRK